MPERQINSPLGSLTVTETNGSITGLRWGNGVTHDTPLLRCAESQLAAYFDGTREGFDLPLKVVARDLQQRVCAEISAIPFGETCTYGDISKRLGVPAQAIGQACGGNPIPILIPCHRVLGARGLGGFSGGSGLETKIWLLRHERAAGLLI